MRERRFRSDDTADVAAGLMIAPGKLPTTARFVARKSRDEQGVAADAELAVDRAAGGSGSALPSDLRTRFESSLGTDLGDVRVHTNAASADAAASVGAKAYTVGQDVHFGAGQYDPTSSEGQILIAHEVAHTVQQRGGAARPQYKLEVSTPGDSAEVEADRAASAMVSGAAAQVGSAGPGIQRDACSSPTADPFAPLPPSQCVDNTQAPMTGGENADLNPFAPQPNRPADPLGPNLQPPDPMQPSSPGAGPGFSYSIPTTDYRGQLTGKLPGLDTAMPTATIPDPGSIPGWLVVRPAKTTTYQLGALPLTSTQPPTLYLVQGDEHSPEAKDAWASYKEFLPQVASTWNGQAKSSLDSFTQQAKGNADLDKMVADTRQYYDATDLKQGGGTVSRQVALQEVQPGANIETVDATVTNRGSELTQGAKDSSAADPHSTVPEPVRAAVKNVNNAKGQTRASVEEMTGKQSELEGAKTSLEAAQQHCSDIANDIAKKDAQENDDAWGKAKAIAQKVNPKLGQLVATIKKYSEPVKILQKIVKSGAEAYEGHDPKAAVEAAIGVAELWKWASVQSDAEDVLAATHDSAELKAVNGAAQTVKGLAISLSGISKRVEENLKKEKMTYDALAAELEKAKQWKGKNGEDAKTAANAMRALPIVERLLRVLRDMKSSLPRLPSAGTRAAQGFTLATGGVHAPGAAELLEVGGWIHDAPSAIGPEITKWETIRTHLQSVAGALGIE